MKKICLPQTVHLRIFIFSAILALAGLFYTPQLDAGIYKWVDEKGVIHYSNRLTSDSGNVKIVSPEYKHDEAADQERVKDDQKTKDALTEEIKTEEQQASGASKCFSPSYSVQQGRGVYEVIIPRDFIENEYQNLQKLFQSLEGNWKGNALVLVCEGTQDKVRKVVDNYSVKSECKMRSTGHFVLETEVYSQKDRAAHNENLRLYLDPKKLTGGPNFSIADIELISVSSDELVYVEKTRSRSGGGSLMRETVTTIKKTGEASFSLKRILYLKGRLITISTWHLESR
jgi:hypothetical protein